MVWILLAQGACGLPNGSEVADPAAAPDAGDQPVQASDGEAVPAREIVLAGGCFWCTEGVIEPLAGVLSVESGYAGGTADTANYQAVSSGTTDHAEVIKVTYDPSAITLGQILKVFFTIAHDPTQLNRQGADRGRHYRSAVFYADAEERQFVADYIAQLEEAKTFDAPIVTTLEPLDGYWPAEAYHQDYAERNPNQPYIRGVAAPKIEKLREHFGDQLQEAAPAD